MKLSQTDIQWLGLPLAQQDVAPTEQAPAAAPVEQETTVAPGETVGKPPATAPWWANQWIPLLLILVMAWLLIFRPKKQQEKQRTQMLSALKKGDRIQTIGGVLGTVVDVRDDEVVVKVDETSNAKITFSRSAIHRVREEAKK